MMTKQTNPYGKYNYDKSITIQEVFGLHCTAAQLPSMLNINYINCMHVQYFIGVS